MAVSQTFRLPFGEGRARKLRPGDAAAMMPVAEATTLNLGDFGHTRLPVVTDVLCN